MRFQEDFYVMQSSLEVALLDETFLIRNKAIIDYQNGIITIVDRTIFMSESLANRNTSLDKTILEKVYIINEAPIQKTSETSRKRN